MPTSLHLLRSRTVCCLGRLEFYRCHLLLLRDLLYYRFRRYRARNHQPRQSKLTRTTHSHRHLSSKLFSSDKTILSESAPTAWHIHCAYCTFDFSQNTSHRKLLIIKLILAKVNLSHVTVIDLHYSLYVLSEPLMPSVQVEKLGRSTTRT